MSINSVGILNFFLWTVIHMKLFILQVKMKLWTHFDHRWNCFPKFNRYLPSAMILLIFHNHRKLWYDFFGGNIMEWCLSILAKIQNCSPRERQLEDIQTKELKLKLHNKPFILVIIAQEFNNLLQTIVKCFVYKFCMIVQCIFFTYLINFLYKK